MNPFTLIVLVVCLSALSIKRSNGDTPQPHSGEESLSAKDMEDLWAQISAARPPFKGDEGDDADVLEYWMEIATERQRHFQMLCLAENHKEAIKFYVNQFGRYGDDADVLWMLASAPFAFGEANPPGYLRKDPYHAIAESFSKEVVRRCLEEVKFRERYYHAGLWSGITIKPSKGKVGTLQFSDLAMLTHNCEKWFNAEPPQLYWYASRNFVFIWYATSWEHPLDKTDADRLDEVYEDFYSKIGGKRLYKLVRAKDGRRWQIDETIAEPADDRFFESRPILQLPEKPFNAWESTPSLSSQHFRVISDLGIKLKPSSGEADIR